MKHIRLIALVLAFLGAMPAMAHAQGAGIEWDILNQEAMELYRAGKYDRAVVVAQKALDVATHGVTPHTGSGLLLSHPSCHTSPHGTPPET